MKIIILGAGIIGISTAWHLLERGHEVVVVDRQPDAALETSFANGAQISVSYCEPWANREAPLKAIKWLFDKEAPLLLRPQMDPSQWSWLLKFLGQCNDSAFERNVQQIVALGAYSHAALKDVIRSTEFEFDRLERGIAHFYTDQKSLDAAGEAVNVMRRYGVQRRVVSKEELFQIEPAFRAYADHITGGTYTSTDESGDARVFTQHLARLCAERGAELLFGHDVERLHRTGDAVNAVTVRPRAASSHGEARSFELKGDAIVLACGSYSAPMLRTVGIQVPIYPGKGYSATFPILKPDEAPYVSSIDDGKKVAISRLGNQLRVAGTIELGGFDLDLDSSVARARCHMLSRRIETILPGVCDTRTPEEGGNPQYWCGLRPATPTNIPLIGRTRLKGLWINSGHGTLGWTHGAGSGKALAELMSGARPAMAFDFMGEERSRSPRQQPRTA